MRITESSRDLVRALIERLAREPTEVVIATFLVAFIILRRKLGFSFGTIVEGCSKGGEMVAFLWSQHEEREQEKAQRKHWVH